MTDKAIDNAKLAKTLLGWKDCPDSGHYPLLTPSGLPRLRAPDFSTDLVAVMGLVEAACKKHRTKLYFRLKRDHIGWTAEFHEPRRRYRVGPDKSISWSGLGSTPAAAIASAAWSWCARRRVNSDSGE